MKENPRKISRCYQRCLDRLFVLLQYMLPQHLLTSVCGKFAQSEKSSLKNFLIKRFIKHFAVDLSEAVHTDAAEYHSFNAFFTRHLQKNARPLPENKQMIISPVDGVISELGRMDGNQLIQAKNRSYSLEALLVEPELAQAFHSGHFITLYLSPKDYHRIHMPIDARLTKMIYVPGKLFSVNMATAQYVDHLFARNERVIAIFETEFGKMAMALVGAMIVGQIAVDWYGIVNKSGRTTSIFSEGYENKKPAIVLQRGQEMGFFQLGSTVVVCFEENKVDWLNTLSPKSSIRMGEVIAMQKNGAML